MKSIVVVVVLEKSMKDIYFGLFEVAVSKVTFSGVDNVRRSRDVLERESNRRKCILTVKGNFSKIFYSILT